MKDMIWIYILAGLIFTGLITYGCVQHDDGVIERDYPAYEPMNVIYTGDTLELANIVCMYRDSLGLGVLKPEALLTKIAKQHTLDMINSNKISHDGFAGRSQIALNNNFKSFGEVVAYGYSSPRGFLEGYKKSPSHKKILDGKYYTHFGVALEGDPNKRGYNTIVFAKINK
jgi:uncharacterized protein YkwD